MTAIVAHLKIQLLRGPIAAQFAPVRGARPIRQQFPQRMQRNGLTQQMRIGRKVHAEVVLQKTAVLVQRIEKRPRKFHRHFAADHVLQPQPGERTKRNLQCTGPIDAVRKRILLQPTPQLAPDLIQIFGLAIQHPCLC